MDNLKEKLPAFKSIVYILAVLAVAETALLGWMIPNKTTLHWMALVVILISLLYVCTLCLRLIKELGSRS